MSDATERFRAGLEERGIEYKAINRLVTDIQRNGLFIRVYDYGDDSDCQMSIETRCKTTEQALEAIAATLGPGTCRNNAPTCLDFLCSECGFVHYHSDANDTKDGNGWGYCPNCGRRVVEVGE